MKLKTKRKLCEICNFYFLPKSFPAIFQNILVVFCTGKNNYNLLSVCRDKDAEQGNGEADVTGKNIPTPLPSTYLRPCISSTSPVSHINSLSLYI